MNNILAIDIDDVLAKNAEGFARFSNERWGHNFTADHYDEDWGKVWGVDDKETSLRALEMHSSGFFGNHKHFPEAVKVLNFISEQKGLDIVAVTSRRVMIANETIEWMNRHFGVLVTKVVFAGLYDEPASHGEMLKRTKAEVLSELKPDYFIDDQIKHAIASAALNIPTILFGNYTWNQAELLPENVTRCNDWDAVANYFGVAL